MSGRWRPARRILSLLVAAAAATAACGGGEPGPALPSPDDLRGVYGEDVRAELTGNVIDVTAVQEADQLRRGGQVWAKFGPYVYLFSPQTRDLLETFEGVGGVRVTTLDEQGHRVARVLLERGGLNSVTWRRAIALAGRARLEGTNRPSYVLELIEYGEETVDYEYSPRYVRKDS
ncbi:MAG: hypothetical protein RRA92_03565 [Gemmatimonadota bacterium]|nr:hypothetical protein [Gemmatimonadota bacterium]